MSRRGLRVGNTIQTFGGNGTFRSQNLSPLGHNQWHPFGEVVTRTERKEQLTPNSEFLKTYI